ncbi:AAA family ATPase [uncultured Oscillibacter sp.]|uniref:AAA family ATPase n=1 Tax=uncultured Oscillibacter sp. TaxID=876091 RepID=UPI0025E14C92|nr:AAA family ATPase [uncultured Oscillibacter sp.]
MEKIKSFQITGMTISGFKSYQEPTELTFGNPTIITGGNGRGKTSVADAIAFAVTGLPFFGERGIDRLHNEENPDVYIAMRFVDDTGRAHELVCTRQKNRMCITYDGGEVRQLDLKDLFGESDVFLSILNPLYFIEELGNEGKNLLGMYLPELPPEKVLEQLPPDLALALKEEPLLSPETYLKNKRADIRNLEESILYMRGQRDQAEAQGKARLQMAESAAQKQTALQEELTALEEKQFAGLDIPAIRDQLVDLSARYEEALRDSGGEEQDRLSELRAKIAKRQAEQYQSKYAQPLAETAAQVKNLGLRYQQEGRNYQFLSAGNPCPTCHRSIPANILPEVQAEIKKSAAAILAEGKSLQAQLQDIQDVDKKAADTFEQFKADDLAKWGQEVSELENRRQALAGAVPQEAADLRRQIETLNASIEYGNLSQEEFDRLTECREALRQCSAELSAAEKAAGQPPEDIDGQIEQANQKITALKKQISNAAQYVVKRAELLFSSLKMNRVEIFLYDVVKTTGEVKDVFKFTYAGRRYDRLSLSEKIRAGMEVSELMKRLTGRNYPVFVDNMESVDDLANVRPSGQVIMAKCVRGAELSVQPMNVPPAAGQKAA